MRVGIEAIAFDTPRHFVALEELADARGVDAAKFTKGLGQTEMSIVTPCEDSVTLAHGAANRALQGFQMSPNVIGLLITGTETGVDNSKPVASFIHESLALPKQCRVFETKHACYGAMAGLNSAIDWILSGRAEGRKALIIATDIALYGVGTPGEPTQGAGAVAFVVSDQPTLLEFHTDTHSYYSRQVMDFWRPIYSKHAFADGHYSIECYLNALTECYKGCKETHSDTKDSFFQSLAACLYHVPFVKMAQKAHQRVCEVQWQTQIEKDTPDFEYFRQDFNKRVSPFLQLNAQVGNIYTGSLFLSLFGLLESYGAEFEGKSISLFSYGSGCCAEFATAQVLSEAKDVINKVSSSDVFARRKKVSIGEYEEILSATEQMDKNDAQLSDPNRWRPQGPLIYKGTTGHRRHYELIES